MLNSAEYSKGSNTHSHKDTGFESVALDYQFLMPDDTSVIYDYAASTERGTIHTNTKFFREAALALPEMTECMRPSSSILVEGN